MSHQNPAASLLPTEPFSLKSSLSLTPRLKLNLTVHRADKSVSPLDEWKLKRSLIDYLKKSHSITAAEEDIKIHKYKDLKKRKRDEAVARGALFVLDLESFLTRARMLGLEKDGVEYGKEYLEWKKGVAKEMDGMELNLEGVRFKLTVEMPLSDDVEGMRKQWEEIAAFGNRGHSRVDRQQPDTIILKGLPSRWFAEPRVSSKPSMLVSHTIFSSLGKIRNLDVAEDNEIGDGEDEDDGNLVSGLNCKIVVRFKTYSDFYNAVKILCGRSLNKEGSRLRADYEVTWDKDGFFQSSRSQVDERKRWAPATGGGNYRSEPSGRASQVSGLDSDDSRRRRFKD